MILTDLQLEGFRRFGAPVRLAGLGAGLNVLAAPNEAGKSTLLHALRAALTLRHSSKSQNVKDLASYGGSAPHVVLHFTWNGIECALEKRFLSKTCTRLTLGPDRFEGDEAEEKLRSLLGLAQATKGDAGLWPALLVGQGESFSLPVLNETGQASLRSCLAQGAESVTGGAAASSVLAKVRERLGTLQTASTNQPTGRYKKALEQEGQAQAQLATLEARKALLEEDLASLEQAHRTLREQTNPERRVQDEGTLAALRAERDAVQQLEGEEKVARANAAFAETTCTTLEQDKQRRTENKAHQKDLLQKCATIQQALESLTPRVQAAQKQRDAAAQHRQNCEKAHEQARKQRMFAAQQAALLQKQHILAREQALLTRAEGAQVRLEQAQATLAALPVNDALMQSLQTAERTCMQYQAQCEAQAPKLSFALLPDAAFKVKVAGAACPQQDLSLLQETQVEIEGIGTFTITPAQHDKAGLFEKWQAAKAALNTLLQQAGCQGMADATTRYAYYRQAQEAVLEARAAFLATLPEGTPAKGGAQAVENMRKQVAQLSADLAQASTLLAGPLQEAQQPAPPTPEAAAEVEEKTAFAAEEARQIERTAQASYEAIQAQHQSMQASLREVEQAVAQTQREEEASLARRPEETLTADLLQARQALLVAKAAVEQCALKRAQARPLAMLESSIERHEQKLENARSTITQLTGDIREREARVRMAEGDGIDEQIAQASRVFERIRLEREGYERERAALDLLQKTLSAAEQEQTERYLAPLLRTMQPAFSSVFPGIVVSLDTQFKVPEITRKQTEAFTCLSDGTREQIAVLVRLGFAELLHAQHGTSLLVLDDALSFSDSQRLERVFDVLAEAATRFQILVLTCHAESFTALGGRRLSLTPIESLTELR
ncbi:GTP-binding protein [Acetobacter orientalis]|uniref:AAA family ATPase n=1 Tax=Acetobacter orientalis TaxID=146474 RepID=UPI00209E29D2|nr:GTP-binding protein [Acetobacter orientalis]MCP1214663.1 GTP-binding protein [Acetobacter orientalis]MCP1218246.1 GTP-binding protein [Acetobacter orientalis]